MTALGSLADKGWDELSPPELEASLHELTAERKTFVELLQSLADWPAREVLGQRFPDDAEIARLNAEAPRPRAVVAHADKRGLKHALALFPMVFVGDPLWGSSHLLYDGWHRPRLAETHAQKMFRALAPVLELAPWIKSGAVYFIPDWLPRAWEPFAMSTDAPARARAPLTTAYDFNRAARLVYWADRLDATAVSGDPAIAPHLRDIAMTTADLKPTGQQTPFGDSGWFSGTGTATLPDLRLAFIRIMDKRTYRNGRPGKPSPLRRPCRFFVNDTVPAPASPDAMLAG